jgi:hypothetical protein
MGYHLFQLLIITQTEYPFLSQQSAMSVRKKAGFLSLERIVWDSENQGAGASSDTIIYLGNSILWPVPVAGRSKA